MQDVWSVIMAGGVGSRFWPVSRRSWPKQLLDLFGQGPLLRVTTDRVRPLSPPERQVVVTGARLQDAVGRILSDLPEANILAEPVGRNTAAAIGWAALEIQAHDPAAVLMVLPADHYIADVDGYLETCRRALALARDGWIVTLGITPTRPETGYGYIRRADPIDGGAFAVGSFKEKPELSTATEYLASGQYYWNSGMFFMPVGLILAELQRFEPDLVAGLRQIGSRPIDEVYEGLESIAIDYAVMERTRQIAVVPGDFGWSDVGSWRTLSEFVPEGESSFHSGHVIARDCSNNVLYAHEGTIAAVDVSGLVVVHTPDATLVCPKSSAQRVKQIVDELDDSDDDHLL